MLKPKAPSRSVHMKSTCPFVDLSLPECYCVDMNSDKVSLVVDYCMKRFLLCDLYQRYSRQEGLARQTDSSLT